MGTPEPDPVRTEDVDDEYSDVDPETVAEDAIEYFSDEPGAADSPAADADTPPPG
jgi:hypothetical protein